MATPAPTPCLVLLLSVNISKSLSSSLRSLRRDIENAGWGQCLILVSRSNGSSSFVLPLVIRNSDATSSVLISMGVKSRNHAERFVGNGAISLSNPYVN